MTLAIQFGITLSLILGIISGEAIATKFLGALNKKWHYVAEIILFISIITLIVNTIAISDIPISLIFYFLVGAITIIFIRYLITAGGIISRHIKKELLKRKDEKDYIIGLKKSLERRGFETKEIKRIAREVGFSRKLIEEVFNFFKK